METLHQSYQTPSRTSLSDNQLFLLTKPSITLYVNDSDDSQLALEALDQAGAWFELAPSTDRFRVYACWKDFDLEFEGMEEIRRLARIVAGVSKPTVDPDQRRSTVPAELKKETQRQLAQSRQQQRQRAEAVISQLRMASAR